MKSFFLLLALAFSFQAHAGTYTYGVQMVAQGKSCVDEASSLAERFQKATGVAVKSSQCRSEQTVQFDDGNYQVYLLGITYQATQSYHPYTSFIGETGKAGNIIRFEGSLYSSMAACLADQPRQAGLYQQYTGFLPVSVACEWDVNKEISRKQYGIRIEGFGKQANARPAAKSYLFSAHEVESINEAGWQKISQILTGTGAVIVASSPAMIAYYRQDGPAPLQNDALPYHGSVEECEMNKPYLQGILKKAGSRGDYIWCNPQGRLSNIHEGNFHLSEMTTENRLQYPNYQSCNQDRDFILGDSRYSSSLGALCAPDIYKEGYLMYLYRKSL